MKPKIVLLSILLFTSSMIWAGKPKKYLLFIPHQKIEKSLYDSIVVVDTRPDTTNLGFVQTGMFNNFRLLISRPDLSTQMQVVIDSLTANEETGKDHLVFHLRKFRLSEETKPTSESGYFEFRADIYALQDNNTLALLNKVDTCMRLSAMDVTGGLLKKSSQIVTDFIAKSLTIQPSSNIRYTYGDMLDIKKEEKKNIKLYTTDTYTNGIYYTFQSFAKQNPNNDSVRVEMKKGNFKKIFINNRKTGDWTKIKAKEVYALVYDGKPYISNDNEFRPLSKDKSGDFYFFGTPDKIALGNINYGYADGALVGGILAGAMGGVAIIPVTTSPKLQNIRIVIDHLNGGHIVDAKAIYGDKDNKHQK